MLFHSSRLSFFIDTRSDRNDGVLTEITNSLVANNFHSATVGIISHRLWPDDRYSPRTIGVLIHLFVH